MRDLITIRNPVIIKYSALLTKHSCNKKKKKKIDLNLIKLLDLTAISQ